MRKLLFLLAVLGTFSIGARAQYYQITALPSGGFPGTAYQTIGGNTIQVDKVYGNCGGGGPGGGFCAPNSTPVTFCGVSPYFIGGDKCGNSNPITCRSGFRYEFKTFSATDLRIKMTGLNDSDTVVVRIPCSGNNCSPRIIPLTNATTSWTSSCSPTASLVGFTFDGRITGLGRPSGFNDVQIDIQNPYSPYVFDSVEIVYTSRARYGYSADGVVYSIEWKNDSCNLRFNVYADTPVCSGRDIKLHASDFPNTVHHWYSTSNPWTQTGAGTSNANPIIPGSTVTVVKSGLYIDSAVRGACIYRDTFNVFVDQTPTKPVVTTAGPKCIGENDTIFAASNLTSGGSYWFYGYPPSGQVGPLTYPNQGNQFVIKNIDNTKTGLYAVYAQSPNGCVSDTTFSYINMNPPVTALFTVNEVLACKSDTIYFTNGSSGSNKFFWEFGDGTSGYSQGFDTSHVYVTPTSAMPKTYSVKLTVGNGKCADDTTVDVVINHPLKAAFTVDDDSICQHTTVNFDNSTSQYTAASIPVFFWNFGDGFTDNTIIGAAHKYDVTGVYKAYMTLTDFLGCTDTAYHTILVDSVGSISFRSSDTALCAGQVIKFYGTYSPVGINSATWDFADGNKILNVGETVHAYDAAGTYKVTFAADYRICNDTTYSLDMLIKPYPIVDLGHDTTICPNGAPVKITDLVNAGSAGITWRWNRETRDSTSSILVYHPGVYAVTADNGGCKTTDSITVFKKCYIDIPNVFTPNGDGSNDYFLPRELLSKGVTKFNMTIYNRWGVIVFQANSINGRGWDGKFNGEDQPQGVYVYLIEASFVNGDSEKYQGNVTLLK